MIDERVGPSITVDRGQPVIVTVIFGDGEPDEVVFGYLRPGSGQPFVDDGFGQERSKIVRTGHATYRYTIATDGFDSGDGEWSFRGEWDRELPGGYDTVVIKGPYTIRPSSIQLP